MWKFHSDHQCRTSSNQRSFAGFEFRCVKGEVSWWLQAPIPFGFVGLSCEAGTFQGISTRVKSVLTCIISFSLVYVISLKPTTLCDFAGSFCRFQNFQLLQVDTPRLRTFSCILASKTSKLGTRERSAWRSQIIPWLPWMLKENMGSTFIWRWIWWFWCNSR